MKTHFLSINGLKHAVYTWGLPKRPPLFLFHGWMDTGASFQWLAPLLKNDFYCIAPDLRGFGQSEASVSPLGYFLAEYMADAHALFHHFSPHHPVQILGHSMGGNFLSLYCGALPERVSHFINIEGFGTQDIPPQKQPKRLKKWLLETHGAQLKESRYPSIQAFAERLQKQHPLLEKKRLLSWARLLLRPDGSEWQLRADAKHRFTNPYPFQASQRKAFWQKIQAHCLLVMGDQTLAAEQWFGVKDIRKELKKRLELYPAHTQKVVIPQCGHMIHLEKPEELAKRVRGFLCAK